MSDEANSINAALPSLLKALDECRTSLPATNEAFNFITGVLKSRELNALVNVHSQISNRVNDDSFHPIVSNGLQIAADVLDLLTTRKNLSADFEEICSLLKKPHIQRLLDAHDAVAQKDYNPRLSELPPDVDKDEETIKIAQLVKSDEPLGSAQSAEPIVGATIATDEQTGKYVVARVFHGGAAYRSGLIHVGDEVWEVNGINVEWKPPSDVLKILQNSEGTIKFKLIPADRKLGHCESKVRVRAHFDYVASLDPFIPCKEAGLDFVKGDILHIVNQDDGEWWQARRDGDRTTRAGLIPSRAHQERMILRERSQIGKRADQENDDFDREEIPTYEEVAKLYPRAGIYRPIVMIGPPGVGRNELRRRLIATDAEKYRTPTPFTSRPMRPGEVNGKEYYFVTREKMEEDSEAGNFIEFGEYKGNLYGTSVESVKMLVGAGHVCIMNPHYQALKMLRTPQLKPFIIYIKPPAFDVLKETRAVAYARSTFDENNSRGFTDDEFKEILQSAERIEFLYSHLFDEIIVNADLSAAFEQLVRAVNRVENEPLWVPASWVQ
ncbi:MAGUK p55 subfamily member 7 isoform X5 [Frankliniella occidentalis]|uniref:MAGUK p55 subfamily member 7 isoform X5 n=1 Tax=Frankliniella occidentalis TaxID=133901 RepID=A0A9C6WYV8_FRAOC|nr:MAGUK p55 subfamily member 7 isoform X5 [Frankliniella occidentalis]